MRITMQLGVWTNIDCEKRGMSDTPNDLRNNELELQQQLGLNNIVIWQMLL